ncbi:DUF3592 domain-containing protein [Glaciecola sp. 1036]|uniref:DUF3592 domain-containing protein n=1 Tax=Alteromonadaceae TaxID=72275 RepID=UPI003D021ED0
MFEIGFWGGSLLCLISFYLLRRNFDYRQLIRDSYEWPQTNGTILKSDARREENGVGRWKYCIDYCYDVSGSTYYGNRLSLTDPDNEWDALSFEKEFPPGSSVKVYFDPASPLRSILIREKDHKQFDMGIALSLVGIVAGWALIIYSYL